jgi:hypothetical protein
MLNVMIANKKIRPALKTNIHQLTLVRYAKSCSHLFVAHQAIGAAMSEPVNTRLTKSFDKSKTIRATGASSTLRTPISFTRVLVTKITMPSRPRQLMTIIKTMDRSHTRYNKTAQAGRKYRCRASRADHRRFIPDRRCSSTDGNSGSTLS